MRDGDITIVVIDTEGKEKNERKKEGGEKKEKETRDIEHTIPRNVHLYLST